MPTLQDVARKAGVSTATVSKVLANKPYVTSETRGRVLQAVEALGYVPHLAARALSSGRTHIVAVIFPYVYDTVFTDPLVMCILEGIERECSARSYNMLLSTPRVTPDGPDSNYFQLIQSGYLDGIIALDNVPYASVITPATHRGIPTVAIGYGDTRHQVQSDDFGGAATLMDHVINLGHHQIALIGVLPELHIGIQRRMDGLRHGASHVGLDFDSLPFSEGNYSTLSGFQCAQELLESYPYLTALICLNDRMAIGAMQYVRQSGRRVPDDITVVGYDDIPLAATLSLTTVNQQAQILGQMSAQMLFSILRGESIEPVTIPSHLAIRHSSAPPRIG